MPPKKYEYTIADYRRSRHAKDDPHFSDEMKEDLARKIQDKIDLGIPPPRNLPEGWTGLLRALLHESKFLSVELDYFSRLSFELRHENEG